MLLTLVGAPLRDAVVVAALLLIGCWWIYRVDDWLCSFAQQWKIPWLGLGMRVDALRSFSLN